MTYEKAKISVIHKYFSDLLRMTRKRIRDFIVVRCQSVEAVILSETALSNSFYLRYHQHGQNRKIEAILSGYLYGRLLLSFS